MESSHKPETLPEAGRSKQQPKLRGKPEECGTINYAEADCSLQALNLEG